MIIGSGMIACAMADARGMRGTVVYAAGVSNSSCTDPREFERDRDRLVESLGRFRGTFVYFSTCSVEDKPYTQHKHACEELVKAAESYLIVRMPIVAGRTSNPHTLLNYLASRIERSERFTVRSRARRNVIDVRDAAAIVEWLVRSGDYNRTVNVAAPQDYALGEIVREFERIYGKPAVADWADEGDAPRIDARDVAEAPVDFSDDYLHRTLRRYYA